MPAKPIQKKPVATKKTSKPSTKINSKTATAQKNNVAARETTKDATARNVKPPVKPRRLNSSNTRVTDLPDFVRAKWRTAVLPTLYDKFFASEEPFSHFFKGSDTFTALLQTIVDEVFPDINYRVHEAEALHNLVRVYYCLVLHQCVFDSDSDAIIVL